MKQLLSSKFSAWIEQLRSFKFSAWIEQVRSSKFFAWIKQLPSSDVYARAKQFLSSKLGKYLLLAVCLLLLLVIGLSRCSAKPEPAVESHIGYVTVENLDVHKKADMKSRVLGQLPMDLEVAILEEKESDDAVWGRIDEMKLPDGKKVKAGWIDLQFVIFEDEIVPEVVEPEPEPEVEAPVVVADMGTITASKLNVRKGPDTKYETCGAYYKGDRVEILETQTVEDTVWGHTSLGWIGMGYVRMDGPTAFSDGDSSTTKITSDGNTTVLGYGVVNLRELNVRVGAGTGHTKVGTVAQGVRYAYYELADGWARIESGWVSTDHFYIEGTVTDSAYSGTVNTDDLNIRSGPDTSFKSVGLFQKGDSVEILAQVGSWGYTEQGWVFTSYVPPVEPTYSTGTGTIANGLNIRLEPNADSEIVGTYTTGDRVTVLEVNGRWGKTDQGWINLKYVIYD